LGEQAIKRVTGVVGKDDVDDVFGLIRVGICAVLDEAEIMSTLHHTLGQQEAGSQIAVGTRRAHDDSERPIVQAYFEWLLGRRPINPCRARPAPHEGDINVAKYFGQPAHCKGGALAAPNPSCVQVSDLYSEIHVGGDSESLPSCCGRVPFRVSWCRENLKKTETAGESWEKHRAVQIAASEEDRDDW